MASVSISDLDPILKEFYEGPIIDALNSQLEMVQLFTKTTLDWQGRRVIIPVHIGRNSGVQYASEGGDLPTAGKQSHVDLQITAKYLYGRFSLTGPAIASAKTTANSFATYVQTEMDGLVTDVKVKANQAMFTGAGAVGFIWEKHDTCVGGVAAQDFNFSGNKDVLKQYQTTARALTGAGVADKLAVDVIRLDLYVSAINLNGAATSGITTSPLTDGTADHIINLKSNDIGGNDSDLYLRGTGAGPGFPHNAALLDNTLAMVVVTTSGANPANTYVPNAVATANISSVIGAEQNGLYGNLGLQTHFSVDRNLVGNPGVAQASTAKPLEGGNHELRAASMYASTTAAGGVAAAAVPLDFSLMQKMLDEIMVAGGDNPDCIYMHPTMRQQYANQLAFTAVATNLQRNVLDAPGKGDPGFTGYSFSNIPVKVSRHCGKGLAIFLNTKVWTITELQAFGMANLDGNVLSRLTNKDEWEGFVRWYYDLVCKEPNRCAVLGAITF
tara:strand:+ start:7776 stop:9272 length:1497 start_codon:yes stop_codon:yes gene_type:complete